MACANQVSTWDPLDYLSTQELARLDERFDSVLRDETYLVFWTGLSLEFTKCWAAEHGLQTLVIALGTLYSDRDVGSPRYGKSTKGWSKYMKGASGRFAEYACRGGRVAIVLTNPPPNTYSTRKRSNYRDLEEPILKGIFGGPPAVQINYVHPRIMGAATFQYQMWPLNKSKEWVTFFRTLFLQGCTASDITDKAAKDKAISKTDTKHKLVVQNQHNILTLACEKQGKCQKKEAKQKNAERQALERKQAKAREKETRRKKAELEQQQARARKQAKAKEKEARQKTAEQQAQQRKQAKAKEKQAKQKNAERQALERKQAKAREKEARRKKVQLEQQQARERKDARRRRAELEQQQARERKEARRVKAESDQQEALKRKEARQKKVEVETAANSSKE